MLPLVVGEAAVYELAVHELVVHEGAAEEAMVDRAWLIQDAVAKSVDPKKVSCASK
jgi:hypothetical protein